MYVYMLISDARWDLPEKYTFSNIFLKTYRSRGWKASFRLVENTWEKLFLIKTAIQITLHSKKTTQSKMGQKLEQVHQQWRHEGM